MKKFEFIYEDIKKKIEDNTYPPGNFLPKEKDLAIEYHVSRETLRKAQKMLEDEGLIKKIHGQGAKVLDFNRFEISTTGITNFSKLSSQHKGNLKTRLLKNKLEYLKPDEFGYADAGQRPGISIERVRLLKEEAVIFDKDFFLVEIVGAQIPEKYLFASIYDYLENEKDLKISFAQKDITIEIPSPELRLILDLGGDSHVVVTRSKVYLQNTLLFQIHEAYQRVDTFHLSDFARR